MEVTSNTALFCQLPPPPKGPVPLSGSDPSVGDGKEKSKLPWEDRATHRLHQEGPTPLQPPGRSRHMRALAGLDLPPVRSGWSSTPMQVPGDSALPGTRQFDKACAQSSCPAWSPGGARGASRAQVPAAGQRNSATHLVPLDEPEAQDVLQLSQTDGTEVQGPPQGLIQAERTLHEAAEPAAVPQAQKVAELVARDLGGRPPSTLPHHLAPISGRSPGSPSRAKTRTWVRLDGLEVVRAPSPCPGRLRPQPASLAGLHSGPQGKGESGCAALGRSHRIGAWGSNPYPASS